MSTMVYGNLALAPERCAPQFKVVSGKKPAYTVAIPRQVAAPDVYASGRARSCSRMSMVLSLVCILAVFSLLAFGSSMMSSLQAAERASAVERTERVEAPVLPGDSLWTVAERHPIAGLSTEETVGVLTEWNELDTSMLVAGMTLIVPGVTA